MKIYLDGNQIVVDRLAPFSIVRINLDDYVVLTWDGSNDIGVYDKSTQQTYKENYLSITDESGGLYGANVSSVANALNSVGVSNSSPKEVYKILTPGADYIVIPDDHDKTLIAEGLMNIFIPNGLEDGFYCTVTKDDIAVQTFAVTGTMQLISNSLTKLESPGSAIIRIQGLKARVEGKLT